MPTATQHLHNRIAVVMDFDNTVMPESYHALVERIGLDAKRFEREEVQPLVREGWDALLARAYRLVEHSRNGRTITRELCADVGRRLEPFHGVPEMFDRVREHAQEIVPEIEVEFYVLSSGFTDIQCATSIADKYDAMWGSEFHFDDEGKLGCLKRMITHPEKVRYVLALSKGLDPHGPNTPAHVWRHIPEEEIHVPLNQMIYLGDGASDLPVFDLLNERGGYAIGVYKPGQSPEDWSPRDQIHPGSRIMNLAPADFRTGAEMLESIILAVRSIANKVALLALGKGE